MKNMKMNLLIYIEYIKNYNGENQKTSRFKGFDI